MEQWVWIFGQTGKDKAAKYTAYSDRWKAWTGKSVSPLKHPARETCIHGWKQPRKLRRPDAPKSLKRLHPNPPLPLLFGQFIQTGAGGIQIRIELEGFGKIGDGLRMVAQALVRVTTRAVGHRVGGLAG